MIDLSWIQPAAVAEAEVGVGGKKKKKKKGSSKKSMAADAPAAAESVPAETKKSIAKAAAAKNKKANEKKAAAAEKKKKTALSLPDDDDQEIDLVAKMEAARRAMPNACVVRSAEMRGEEGRWIYLHSSFLVERLSPACARGGGFKALRVVFQT